MQVQMAGEEKNTFQSRLSLQLLVPVLLQWWCHVTLTAVTRERLAKDLISLPSLCSSGCNAARGEQHES